MRSEAITIRDALPEDMSLLLTFIRKKAAFDGVPDWVEATEHLLREQLFSERPAAFVTFGELGGKPVGFAIYFLTFSSFLGRPGIWLDDLYVDEAYRGRGVGAALLTHLAKVAEAKGYARIEWVTAVDNEKGLAFYHRNGAALQNRVRLLRLGEEELTHLARAGAV